jgi:hypothetical protein
LSAESRRKSGPVHRNDDAKDSILRTALIVRLRIWLVKRKLNLAGWVETRQPRSAQVTSTSKLGIETSSSRCRDTSFRVAYRKPDRGAQLVARLDYFQNEQKGSNHAGRVSGPRLEARQ